MKSIHEFRRAIAAAGTETSHFMTAHLQKNAADHGWSPKVIRHMSVDYNGGKFSIKHHPDHADEVHKLEYGTPDSQPTAAMRKFANRQHEFEDFLISRIKQHVGEL